RRLVRTRCIPAADLRWQPRLRARLRSVELLRRLFLLVVPQYGERLRERMLCAAVDRYPRRRVQRGAAFPDHPALRSRCASHRHPACRRRTVLRCGTCMERGPGYPLRAAAQHQPEPRRRQILPPELRRNDPREPVQPRDSELVSCASTGPARVHRLQLDVRTGRGLLALTSAYSRLLALTSAY